MSYQIDQLGRIWLDGGVVVENCGRSWDEYLEWVAAGNTAEEVTIEP